MAAAAASRASFHLRRPFLLRTAYAAANTANSAQSKGMYGYCETGLEYGIQQTMRNTSTCSYPSLPHALKPMMHNVSRHQMVSQATSARYFSSDSKISIGPQNPPAGESDEKETGIVYYGPISSTIKKVKLLSLSTCCLSVSLGPIITFMTSQDLNVIVKGVVASSVILMSASTTGALHWLVSPYIHKLTWQPGSDSFEVEMMSWMATFTPRTIKFRDIRPAETSRPYVTFKAGNDFYFIDAEHCRNKALLQKLTPQKPLQSAFKNI